MDGSLVKAKDGKIYSPTSSEDFNKFLYRYLFPQEDLKYHTQLECPIRDRFYHLILNKSESVLLDLI